MSENTYIFENYKMQEIFYKFYTSGTTGVIKVYFPLNIIKTVYFSEGNIVFATSNSEKDKLTNILIKHKKITREQLNMAIKQMDKSISLGRNLVNMGLISHKELVWAVKIQVLSIVYSIIMLKEGEYTIVEGFLPDGIIKLPFNTLKIIFDSLLLFKDKDWISKRISPDVVFTKTKYFDEYRERILPNSDYSKIYQLLDEKKTVSEIISMVDLEDFRVYKLLYALKFLNLIEEYSETENNLEITMGNDEVFEIEGDDTEEINMVKEMVMEDEKQKETFDVEFEGASSEHSLFEEDVEKKLEEKEDNKYSFAKDEMDSIVLDEDDYADEENITDTEHPSEYVKTVSTDKKEYFGNFKNNEVEEGKKEQSLEQETQPVSSPFQTEKQKITPEFKTFFKKEHEKTEENIEEAQSGIIEEEFVEPEKSGAGIYVSIILVLFIFALGFLGYKFYLSGNVNRLINGGVNEKEKVVTRSKDITTHDITIEQIDGKLKEKNLSKEKSGIVNNKIKAEKIEVKVKDQQNVKQSKGIVQNTNEEKKHEIREKKEKEIKGITATVVYEEKPVYKEEATTKNIAKTSLKSGKTANYTEFIDNTKNKLIANPEKYTIQLELACQNETLDKAIKLLPEKEKIFFVPLKFNGKECFIICYGIYETSKEAKETLNTLDKEFFQENTPLIRQGKKFKRYIK